MSRNAVLVVVLISFISSLNLAIAADYSIEHAELAKKFTEAQNLASQGQIKHAIATYQSIILANPLLPEAYNNLAGLYLKQKDTKQAKYILEQGLHAHKGYGVLYESLTAINVAMAKEAYSKALQIDLKPSDIEIASLSLSDKKANKKNSIIISHAQTPVKKSISAPAKQQIKEQAKVATSVGEIKRNIHKAKPKQFSVVQQKNTQEIEKTLQAWSTAWSAQAVDMYLSFYHSQYKPTNGLSRKGWVQSRRFRLKKPNWIKIGLSNFEVKKNTGKQAVVNFKQKYQSNSLKDVSKKQMILLHTDDGWRIFSEKSI